jgi:hypothetical protein
MISVFGAHQNHQTHPKPSGSEEDGVGLEMHYIVVLICIFLLASDAECPVTALWSLVFCLGSVQVSCSFEIVLLVLLSTS